MLPVVFEDARGRSSVGINGPRTGLGSVLGERENQRAWTPGAGFDERLGSAGTRGRLTT